MSSCEACLARTWLLGRLSGHLDVVRGRIGELLALDDHRLIRAIGGADREAAELELAAFSADAARDAARRAGVALLCRCEAAYPARLRGLSSPPAVLHIAGSRERFLETCRLEPVALVGTREPTAYGADMAALLAGQLVRAGVPVISGMARGIDAAAHRAALRADAHATAAGGAGVTVAVLPAGPDRPYPRAHRALHGALIREASIVSELAPSTPLRRWMFPARNRIVAALSVLVVVVEAGSGSGSLVTARIASELGRGVGAVPGRTTTAQAAGPLELIGGGATLVRDTGDVLEAVYGADSRELVQDQRPPLTTEQRVLLRELESGAGTAAALARAGLAVDRGLAELAVLELAGRIRRGLGGAYSVIP